MKIIDDTLKKPNGKYDKQALTFFVSFVLSIVLGVSNTILSYVLNITDNAMADNVFNSFMILTGALSGANIANKIADYRTQKTNENNNSLQNNDTQS